MRQALVLALAFCACSPAPGEPPAAEGAAGPGSTAASGGATSSSSTGLYSTCGIENGQHPVSVPEDWVRWTCDPGCVFWLPPDHGSMPQPIEWEPCPSYAAHDNCRQMRTPWSDGDGEPTGQDVGFSVDQSGTARMMVGRNARNGQGDPDSYFEWVIGEVDGPLDFAMRWDFPFGCGAVLRQFHQEFFALSLHGDGSIPIDTDIDALLLGQIGSLEPVMPYRNPDTGKSDWAVGPSWVLQHDYGSKITAHTHDFSSAFLFYGPHMNPDGAPYNGRSFQFGREVLFQAGDYTATGIWAYDDERGTHPLVTFPGDTTQGAVNLGTDGVDIVWTHGTGKEQGEFGLYPNVSIMTAPYTTDPAALEPRRLRTDMSVGIGTKGLQFAVGCGYAGRVLATSRDVEIVRLEDGAAWVLQGNDSWKWSIVLGFTCEEAFVMAQDTVAKNPFGVTRVPLSSLGEPLPPD